MRKPTLLILATFAAVFGLWIANTLADSGTYSVEVTNKTEFKQAQTTDGAIVQYIGDSNTSFGASGTGLFNSFVRIQGSPTERGYNTNGTVEFDTKTGNWTHAILVSEIPVVTVAGVQYWELFSDINESNTAPKISLDELKAFFTTNANLTGYPSSFPTPQYAFVGTIKINDVNQGSGRGDLRYLIPVAPITIPAGCGYGSATCTTYFVLYTKWGGGGPVYTSDGGFEEWKVKIYPISTTATTSNPTGTDVVPGTSVTDTATVSGGAGTPTGTVTFFLCQPADVTAGGCEGTAGTQVGGAKTLNASGVATSDATTDTTAIGTYCWRAEYSGDSVYLPSSHTDATGECFTTVKASPTMKTAPSLVPNDTATLAGTINPTGTITFSLYAPNAPANDCSGTPILTQAVTVSGNGPYPTTNTTAVTGLGLYKWKVEYSGDVSNFPTSSTCGVESFTLANSNP